MSTESKVVPLVGNKYTLSVRREVFWLLGQTISAVETLADHHHLTEGLTDEAYQDFQDLFGLLCELYGQPGGGESEKVRDSLVGLLRTINPRFEIAWPSALHPLIEAEVARWKEQEEAEDPDSPPEGFYEDGYHGLVSEDI